MLIAHFPNRTLVCGIMASEPRTYCSQLLYCVTLLCLPYFMRLVTEYSGHLYNIPIKMSCLLNSYHQETQGGTGKAELNRKPEFKH